MKINFNNIINGIINNNGRNDLGELRAASDQFNDAKRLALIISRNSGVEAMRVNLNEVHKEISKNREGIYTSMTLTFKWQGTMMTLFEDYDFTNLARTLILSINGEKVVKVFWSVNAGLTCHHYRDLTSSENWFLSNVLMKAIWKWSHTSGRLIYLNQKIRIGEVEIAPNEEKTTIMAQIGDEIIPMMGHTLRGCCWWSSEPRLQEAIQVIKKAFTKPF